MSTTISTKTGWTKRLGLLSAAPLALAAFTAGCATETAADEPVGESSDALLAGRRLSESEIASQLRAAGFPDAQIGRMVCTARYESSFYEEATNRNTNGSIDRGLFQINSIHLGSMRGCGTSADALFDAAANTRCAFAIWRAQGNRAWYGYRAHQAECDAYSVRSGGAAPAPSGAATGQAAPDASGACSSVTLGRTVPEHTCVQSSANGVWYQCNDARWYRGGDAERGTFGQCAASYPR